jgi:hypothetical protein
MWKTGMATSQHSNDDRVLEEDGMEDPLPTQVALDKHAMEDGHRFYGHQLLRFQLLLPGRGPTTQQP